MPEQIKEILQKVKDWWNKFTSRQKTIIIGLGATVIFAFAIIIYVTSQPQYVDLISCETEAEAAEVKELLDGADKEKMIVIPVDTKCRPVGIEVVAVGRLNQLASEPRDIFKYAITSNAYGIILVHNHPSGNCEASMEDKKFTETMREAGKFLGIELIDHVIVGEENTYYSIRENEQWDK